MGDVFFLYNINLWTIDTRIGIPVIKVKNYWDGKNVLILG